nr:hypothetical protein [uncultured Trichococcus sp.]
MKDLQSLSEQILKQAQAKGQSKLEESEKISIVKIEESRLKLVEQQKNRKAAILKKIANDFDRERQTLKNKERNAVLLEKQQILKSVFKRSLETMYAWDKDQFANFVQGVLSGFDSSTAYTIVPGAKSIDHFQGEPMQKLLKSYPAVKVAKETIPNRAGFILQEGGVDYNFCFDELIEEVKKEYSAKLAVIAFKEEQ